MGHQLPLADRISGFDYDQIVAVLQGWREPDFIIQPGGNPYIFRWYVIPRRIVGGNVYLHVQVADDSDRGLHDHPWDNQSVILSGGYRETYNPHPERMFINPGQESYRGTEVRDVHAGRVIHRRAEEAHRLELLPGVDYTISLFSTGPVVREWGFWEHPDGWRKAISDGEQGASVP